MLPVRTVATKVVRGELRVCRKQPCSENFAETDARSMFAKKTNATLHI